MQDLWQEEARRLGGETLVQIIKDIRSGQEGIIKTLEHMEQRHTASEAAMVALNKAFPGEDPVSHRRYHETMIEMLGEKRRLRMAIQEKTISGLIWSLIVFVGLAIAHYIKTKEGG